MTSDEPLRVLSVLHSLEPGGVERDVLRFTKAWRDRGVDARIALGRWEGRLQEEAPDVPYIILQKPGQASTAAYETFWMMRKLPAVLRKERPQVLFCASNGLMAVAAVMKILLGKQCPPIVLRISNSLHRSDMGGLHRFLHRAVMRVHSRIYAAIVGMSPASSQEIIEEMGATPQQVVTIMNASMTTEVAQRLAAARDAAPRDHAGRRFLAIGRLAPQKNFDLLLDAFARIVRPDDRLTIVGEGSRRQALEQRAAQLGIVSQLDLPGHHNPVDQWFAEADAFILSSDFEGVPAVISEALAAGIPIVATNCAVALPEMIEGVGRLVPIKDLDALAAAMDKICDDPVDVAAMRVRAAQFTMEATLDQWIDLFRRVAA